MCTYAWGLRNGDLAARGCQWGIYIRRARAGGKSQRYVRVRILHDCARFFGYSDVYMSIG